MIVAAAFFGLADWLVLIAYFVVILGTGVFFWRRNRSADDFSAGGRTLPGWLCGLSIFATYLSSVSYLALPGKAFSGNWNVLMYSLALPLAAIIATRFFVPMYRRSGEISAYRWFEDRFGLWARVFASCFYLLYQIARIGVVMYLMALPMAVLFGWDIRVVILATGVVVTGYSFIGGIVAVIWADAIQAIVLLAGALLALGILIAGVPGGFGGIIDVASSNDKFSLGETSPLVFSRPTMWVVLAFGLFDNLRNFGVDQSYVQRYIAAKSDREANKSVWIGALLYVPVSALFLLIGTSLYAYYQTHPSDLQQVRRIVAEQRLMQQGVDIDGSTADPSVAGRVETLAASLTDEDLGDRVFPHFIAANLPAGVRGLLIAAIFAAAMSTVSTSLNSSATLVMSDFYRRLYRPDADDAGQIRVLRFATVAWGIMGTAVALILVLFTNSVLDIWWAMSGVLGAAIVGLFLFGLTIPGVVGRPAMIVAAAGTVVIAWMTVSQTQWWPERFASTLHPFLVIVVGPLTMMGIGWAMHAFGVSKISTSGESLSDHSSPNENRD